MCQANQILNKMERIKYTTKDLNTLEQISTFSDGLMSLAAAGKIPKKIGVAINNLEIPQKIKEVENYLEEESKAKDSIAVYPEKKQVRIGREWTPLFETEIEKLRWTLEGEQFREEGKTMVEIYFKRSDDIEVRPGAQTKGKVRFSEYNRYLPLEEFKEIKKEMPRYIAAVKTVATLAQKNKKSREEIDEYNKAEGVLEEIKKKYPDSEWVLSALRLLNAKVTKQSIEMVAFDPYFVDTPFVIERLENFTSLVNRQLESGKGITIIEGDAGTGKNKLVDRFAYLTNRQLFRFTCSASKDEQDLKYLLEYDPKRGTYRIKSTVVVALETPGAILELDEINTMDPGVAKATLNSLFDHGRTMFLGEGGKVVKAAKGVLFVGLQNPQNYVGVKPLPETIAGRARIMFMHYPPLERKVPAGQRKELRSDEALIIRQEVKGLKELTRTEFETLWESVVNGKAIPAAADVVTKERKMLVDEIKEVLEIANKLREAYSAYHDGSSQLEVQFIFSMRETIDCAYELNRVELTEEDTRARVTKAKKSIKEVILPKIPRGEQRKQIEALIDQI